MKKLFSVLCAAAVAAVLAIPVPAMVGTVVGDVGLEMVPQAVAAQDEPGISGPAGNRAAISGFFIGMGGLAAAACWPCWAATAVPATALVMFQAFEGSGPASGGRSSP